MTKFCALYKSNGDARGIGHEACSMGHGVCLLVITETYRAKSGSACYDVGGILEGIFLQISIGKCTNQGSRRSLLAIWRLEAKLRMEYWNVGMMEYWVIGK